MALLEHWGPPVLLLAADERIEVYAEAADARVVVTDRRVLVATEMTLTLDVALEQIRRVQFDVAKGQPAMLLIEPESAADWPYRLPVEAEQFEEITRVVSVIGSRLQAVEAAPAQEAADQ